MKKSSSAVRLRRLLRAKRVGPGVAAWLDASLGWSSSAVRLRRLLRAKRVRPGVAAGLDASLAVFDAHPRPRVRWLADRDLATGSPVDRSSPAVQRRTPLRTITSLIASGVLDAELAALVWLLVEGRVPLVVAGDETSATATLEAFLDLGAGADPGAGTRAPTPVTVEELVRRAASGDATQADPLGAVVTSESLEDLFRALAGPPSRLTEDEIRALGVVLIQRTMAPGGQLRVVAAHYVRPLERDGHGHLQRRPPAVLATWDPASATFEHFAWGVTPELASRIGWSQANLERRQARRARQLHGLVHAGVTDAVALGAALDRYRLDEQLAAVAPANGNRGDEPQV